MDHENTDTRVDENPNPSHEEAQSLDFHAKNGAEGSYCVQEVVKKKRGRKSKTDKQEIEKNKMLDATSTATESVKKKRGRKSNKDKEEMEKEKMSDATSVKEGVSEQRESRKRKKDNEIGQSEISDYALRGSIQEMMPKVSRKKTKVT